MNFAWGQTPVTLAEEHFHIGTVLSVLTGDPAYSPQKLEGQVALVNFIHGADLGLAARNRREQTMILRKCAAELVRQQPGLKPLEMNPPSVEAYKRDIMDIAHRYSYRRLIKQVFTR